MGLSRDYPPSMVDAERSAIHQGRGKWGQPGVPHKGWVCVGEYDTFEHDGEGEFETCGMCESAQVRFVHIMENDRYPDQLLCGCICAGHMEEDLRSAELRDKGMRSRSARRDHFPDRKGWKTSPKGTPYIRVPGYHLMVVRRGDGFFAVGATPEGRATVWGRRRYSSVGTAGDYDVAIDFRLTFRDRPALARHAVSDLLTYWGTYAQHVVQRLETVVAEST